MGATGNVSWPCPRASAGPRRVARNAARGAARAWRGRCRDDDVALAETLLAARNAVTDDGVAARAYRRGRSFEAERALHPELRRTAVLSSPGASSTRPADPRA